MSPNASLRELDTNLWVAEQPQRFLGLEIGTRMSVVRLGSDLVVHSPIRPTPPLMEALAELGRVRWVVAPNSFHHLYAEEFLGEAGEAAVLLAPPGLAKKRPELPVAGLLAVATPEEWAPTLECVRVEGMPQIDEAVLFHQPSRTLIATDLAFNIGPGAPFATRLSFRVLGGYGELGPSLVERLATRDKDAARRSLRRVLAWDFQRAIVAHGNVVEQGAKESLERGYAWLFDA